jgi:hypothetical protein
MPLLLGICLWSLNAIADEAPVASPAAIGDTLVIENGDSPRTEAPASAVIDGAPAELDSVALVEVADGQERVVVTQIVEGPPTELWWMIRGELPARSRRSYRIVKAKRAESPRGVVVDRDPKSLLVRVGESKVLQYNMAHVVPPGELDPKFGRSAHIHPCWTPSGSVVTDEFPPDHAHQSGIFLAYTKTEFEGRTPNFWDLLGGTGRVRFESLNGTTSGPVFGEFDVDHEHVDLSAPEPKPALHENWKVRVWNRGGHEAGYWICDLISTVSCATDSPLKLPTYHYGGMAFRGARSWDAEHARILTAEGKDRLAGNHSRPWWCDLSGPVGEREAGITFFTHPQNFRAPEPLRIHPTMPYMVYTPSQLGDWEIAPGSPHVSRYRFVFHDGEMKADAAERLWRDFSQPLVARRAK